MRAGGVGLGPCHDFGQLVGGLDARQRIVGRQAIARRDDTPTRRAFVIGRGVEAQDDGRMVRVFRGITAGGDASGDVQAQQAFRHLVPFDQLHGESEKLLR